MAHPFDDFSSSSDFGARFDEHFHGKTFNGKRTRTDDGGFKDQAKGRVIRTAEPSSAKLEGCIFVTNEFNLLIPIQPLAICYYVKCPDKYVAEIERAVIKQFSATQRAYRAGKRLGNPRGIQATTPLQGRIFEFISLGAAAQEAIEPLTDLEMMRAYETGFNPIIRLPGRTPGTAGSRVWKDGKSELPDSFDADKADQFACLSLLSLFKIEL